LNDRFWPEGVIRLVIHSTAAADPKQTLVTGHRFAIQLLYF